MFEILTAQLNLNMNTYSIQHKTSQHKLIGCDTIIDLPSYYIYYELNKVTFVGCLIHTVVLFALVPIYSDLCRFILKRFEIPILDMDV